MKKEKQTIPPLTPLAVLTKALGKKTAERAIDALELESRRQAKPGEWGAIVFATPGGEFNAVHSQADQ